MEVPGKPRSPAGPTGPGGPEKKRADVSNVIYENRFPVDHYLGILVREDLVHPFHLKKINQ